MGLAQVGCVMTASPTEFDHHMRRASVLLLKHDEAGTIGINLDSPTSLSIGEATEGLKLGILGKNLLFSGGETGGHLCRNQKALITLVVPSSSSRRVSVRKFSRRIHRTWQGRS